MSNTDTPTPPDFGARLDEILYHLYESSGGSKYVRSDHVNRPLHPDEAKRAIIAAFKEVVPKKKTGPIELGEYKEDEIDQIEDDTAVVIMCRQGFNAAIAEMLAGIGGKENGKL